MDRIHELVQQSRKVLVVSHIDPDGDAVGTQLAFGKYLSDMGKDVCMVRDSAIPGKYNFLPQVDHIRPAASLAPEFTIDTAVILECPQVERIGSPHRFIQDDTRIINIDHHRNGVELGDVNWIDVNASSVGEMVYEYFLHVGYSINPAVAQQLYTAILTDTGRFRYSSTSPRTMSIAGELIRAGANPRKICDNVYYNLRPSAVKLLGKVLNGIEFYQNNRFCLLTLTNEMLTDTGADSSESEGLADFTLFNQGVRAGALLKEIDDCNTKVSLRSNNGLDVARIAAMYGGGGHINAAGCVIPLSLDKAKEELIRHLTEADYDKK